MLLLSCTNFDDHLFKVDKKAESINGIQLAVSLTGDDFIKCKGVVKYGDVILQHFDIVSNSEENP